MPNPTNSTRPATNKPDCGVFNPDIFWGRVLPHGPIVPDADLPFEERVERAVRRLMAGFHKHEHDRLREMLGRTFSVNSHQPSLISAATDPEHKIT